MILEELFQICMKAVQSLCLLLPCSSLESTLVILGKPSPEREVIWNLLSYLLRWYQQREPAVGGRERSGAVSSGLRLRLLV